MNDQIQRDPNEVSAAKRLVDRVRTRMRLRSFCRSVYVWLVFTGILFAAGTVASRLTGYGVDWFHFRTALCIPILSLLCGFVTYRRPGEGEAARVVDRFGKTKDLFLAMSYLDSAAGGYQPLVTRAAEHAAKSIRPQLVVEWHAWRPTRNVALIGGCLAAGLLWIPQLDPFGQIQASNQIVQEKRQLAESRRLTTMRTEALKKTDQEHPKSMESSRAVEELKKLLKAAKPQDSQKNHQELSNVQKDLNHDWKKLDAGKLREMLNQGMIGQEFGESTGRQKEWMKELREGKTDEIKKELNEIKEMVQELAAAKDPVKKQALEQKLKKKLRDLQQFAEKKTSKKELANALERAMNQLQMATKGDKLDPEAMEALKESLDLTDKELEQLAKDVKDLKNVEDAMQVAQMAQQLNRAGKLEGKKCEGCEGLADYEELLRELLEEMSEGEGMGNRGQGRGGKAPENEEGKSGFKDENDASPVKAGKMLMSLTSKGAGEKGESKEEYLNLVRTLQQGVSEAIRREDIPPGYQENIKKYFEDLDEGSTEKKSSESPTVESEKASE